MDNTQYIVTCTLTDIVFYNMDTQKIDYQLSLPDSIGALAISLDYTTLVATSTHLGPNKVYIISLTTTFPTIITEFSVPYPIDSISLTPDANFLLILSTDYYCQVLNLQTQVSQLIEIDSISQYAPNTGLLYQPFYMCRLFENRVRELEIDSLGVVYDTGRQSHVINPFYALGTSDGDYLFITTTDKNIVVIDRKYFGVASITSTPYTLPYIAITHDNQTLYSLQAQPSIMEVYSFSEISKRLTLLSSFRMDYFASYALQLSPTNQQFVFFSYSPMAGSTVVVHALDGSHICTLPFVSRSNFQCYLGNQINSLPHNAIYATDDTNLQIYDAMTLQQLGVVHFNTTLFGIAISHDIQRAILTTFYTHEIIELDLSVFPPLVLQRSTAPNPIQGPIITLDNQYAIIYGEHTVTYNLETHEIKSFEISFSSLAVDYNNPQHFYGSKFLQSLLYRYSIDADGNVAPLTPYSQYVSTGPRPISIAPTPDGNFMFVTDFYGYRVEVFDTSSPNYFGYTSSSTIPVVPHTVICSNDGQYVYVLDYEKITKFSFNSVSKRLTQILSFPHNTGISAYGVDRMVLDATNTRLFVAGVYKISVWTTEGGFIQDIPTSFCHSLSTYSNLD